MLKKILILVILICASMVSCEDSINSKKKSKRIIPEEFEIFDSCASYNAHYRVFAKNKYSFDGYKVYALMIGWMDTARFHLSPRTIYKIKHRSGKTITVENSDKLLSYWDFRDFVHDSPSSERDTILTMDVDLSPIEPKGKYDFAYIDKPFLFLDVTFDGKPELLVKRNGYSSDSYYNVYDLKSDGPHKMNEEPFIAFKTSVNSWMFGTGTIIDYDNKTITLTKLKEGSCSDHGTLVYVTFIYDSISSTFNKRVETKAYDYCN